jgi:uncharacterized protein YbcI
LNGGAAAAISNQIVHLFASYYGRGPTRVRTMLTEKLAVVTLRDAMTRAEERLVASGDSAAVRDMRHSLQEAMRAEAVSAIEATVGRGVAAYLTDIDTDANVAIVAFVLDDRPTGKLPDGPIAA